MLEPRRPVFGQPDHTVAAWKQARPTRTADIRRIKGSGSQSCSDERQGMTATRTKRKPPGATAPAGGALGEGSTSPPCQSRTPESGLKRRTEQDSNCAPRGKAWNDHTGSGKRGSNRGCEQEGKGDLISRGHKEEDGRPSSPVSPPCQAKEESGLPTKRTNEWGRLKKGRPKTLLKI